MKSVFALLVFALPMSGPAAAQIEKKPEFAFSAAGIRAGRTIAGPLYKKVNSEFKKIASGGQPEFNKLFSKDAKLRYYTDISLGPKIGEAVFTASTVKALTESCVGPYSYDEGTTWVQLSWVCRTKSELPISKIVKFRDSPEMSLTIWFEKGLIKELRGMEPLPIPGAKRFTMNAADQVPETR